MNKEKQIVPALRFPEFENDGEWKDTELGKCLLMHPEYGIGAAAVPYSENLPTYLRITDISVDGKFKKDNKVSVAKKVSEDNYLNDGDIVFARTGASVGKSYKYRVEDGKLVFAGFLIRVKPDVNKLNSELLFQFVSTEQYWQWVKFVSARSGQPGINGNQYASMPILLPPKKEEQQKIAVCLSSVDTLITVETNKLEHLKDHKKGLFQQLFPANGETKPQFRFPEFVNDEDWEEKELGKISKITTGSSNREDSTEEEGDYAFFDRSEDIRTSSRFLFDSEAIIVAGEGQKFTPKYFVGKFDLHQRAYAILNFDKNTIGKFLFYYIYNNNDYFLRYAVGSTVKSLRQPIFENMPVLIPKNPKEQQKIADCFSNTDDLLEAQKLKIKRLKKHKKGLMQQLFPNINK